MNIAKSKNLTNLKEETLPSNSVPADDVFKSQRDTDRHNLYINSVNTLLNNFEENSASKRILRRHWSYVLVYMLVFEVFISGILIFLMGYNKVTITPWVADVFFVSVFTQVVLLAKYVVQNLFPNNPKELINNLSELDSISSLKENKDDV